VKATDDPIVSEAKGSMPAFAERRLGPAGCVADVPPPATVRARLRAMHNLPNFGLPAGVSLHGILTRTFRAKVRGFIDLMHVYPSMAEALKIVAISRFKDPAKLSCCGE
jgi:hypothetical protein